MADLSICGVKKYMDATLVLKNITFLVNDGEKVGIVGENGSGKSTILKLIAGVLPFHYCVGYPGATSPGYDEGWVVMPKHYTCAYLDQLPSYPAGMTVFDVLNLAFDEVNRLEKEMRSLEEEMKVLEGKALEIALKRYSETMQMYEVKGGYEIQEKLSKVCKGLKFEDSFLRQEFNSLSGGEKTTAVLGKLLIDNPNVLLLDEPTNHLDMEAVEWLEEYLKSYKGIVIIVSHDRYFLDHVVTKIIEIEDKECITYRGNYSDYVRTKEENLRVQYDNFRDQQKQINAMEKSVKELRDWAMRADNNKFFQRATSIQIKLDKLDRIEKPVFEKQNMKLNLNSTQRSGNITIKAVGLSKSYGDKKIFCEADMIINYGERVALIGPNGSGKTTFLKLLLGEEQQDAGEIGLGANVLPAYLPQHIVFPNEEETVLDCFREDKYILEGKAREYLSKFMFFGANVFKKVRHLSGGERIRLKLAKLLFEDINLLILDEPTNHLDTESIETIEAALSKFKGTIFFISHDRYFINKIGERVIAIEDHALKSYEGNYEAYKLEKETHTQQQAVQVGKPSLAGVSQGKEKQKSYSGAKEDKDDTKGIATKTKNTAEQEEKSKNSNTLKNKQRPSELKKGNLSSVELEKQINQLEQRIQELDHVMNTPGISYEELNLSFNQREALAKELDLLMESWVEGEETCQ